MIEKPKWAKNTHPKIDESLPGFLNRFARENGLTSRKQMMGELDLPLSLYLSPTEVESLAQQIGIDSNILQDLNWSDKPTTAVRRRSMLRAKVEAICPPCLKESPHSRQLWSHRMATCCNLHGNRLIDTCSTCGQPISRDRWHPSYCECGADLRKLNTTKATNGEKIFSSLLLGHTPSEPVPLDLSAGAPTDIDLFTLAALKHVINPNDTGSKTGLTALPSGINETANYLMPIFDILGGKANIAQRKIEALVHHTQGETSSGPAKRFGQWYKVLFDSFKHKAYTPWREYAANAISKEADVLINSKTRRIQSLAIADKGWMSAAQAAKILGISEQRLHGAIDQGGIEANEKSDNPSYRHRLISKSEVSRLQEIRDAHITDTQAREMLRAPKSVYELLKKSDWIEYSDPQSLPDITSGFVKKQSITSIIERLTSSKPKKPGKEHIALCTLNSRNTKHDIDLLAVYRRIASGELPVAGHDGSAGIAGVYLLKESIEAQTDGSSDTSCALTLEQVSLYTGSHYDAVKGWVLDGLLKATAPTTAKATAWQVQIPDLINFLMTYAPLAQLAAKGSTTSRSIASKLNKAGIKTFRPSTGRGDVALQSDLLVAIQTLQAPQ